MHLVQAAELESVVAERTQNIATAETTLKLKELEFERRATALEAEHAAKMASMLQQMRLLQDSNARTEPQAEARQALAAQQSCEVLSAELGTAVLSHPEHQGESTGCSTHADEIAVMSLHRLTTAQQLQCVPRFAQLLAQLCSRNLLLCQ